MTTLTHEKLQQKRRYWLADNKGVITRTAREFGVSPVFVSDVLWGRRASKTGHVERRLAELGAPGFTLDQPATQSHTGG